MKLNFFKYQGAGNDFILFDDRNNDLDFISEKHIKKLCNRRFGIGADGLMILKNHPKFDFEMIYYNADGKMGTMCGNGGRCIVAFAKQLGIFDKETNFLAVDGAHYAKITDKEWISLQMIDVNIIINEGNSFILNTGSPHYVKESNNLKDLDVYTEGYKIRNSKTFKEDGINVNFVEVFPDHLFVRTFERGVEDETYACGTGATAAAMAIATKQNLIGNIESFIKVLGGNLQINFNYDGQRFKEVFLSGPADMVFEGIVIL